MSVQFTRWGVCALLVGFFVSACEAAAGDRPSKRSFFENLYFNGNLLKNWDLSVGGGVSFGPKYEGSDELEASPFPFVSATWNDSLTIDPRGISLRAYGNESFGLDLSLGYDPGRNEDDSEHLRGLGDIDWALAAGVKGTYSIGPATLFATVNRDFGGSDGLTGKFGAEVSHRIRENVMISLGASATWADENHMDAYFGVTPTQSARSGLAVFDPSGGLKRVDLEIAATWFATEHWLVRAEAEIGYLIGDAADSPITQEVWQPSVMMAIGYKF